MRGGKAREGLGAEAYLQYVEHPNRVQRRQRAALWFRSRKLVRNVGSLSFANDRYYEYLEHVFER